MTRRGFFATLALAVPAARALAAILERFTVRHQSVREASGQGVASRGAGEREVWRDGDEMLVTWYRREDGTHDGPYVRRLHSDEPFQLLERDGALRVERG